MLKNQEEMDNSRSFILNISLGGMAETFYTKEVGRQVKNKPIGDITSTPVPGVIGCPTGVPGR